MLKECRYMDIQTLAQQFYSYSQYMRGYAKGTLKRYKFVINFYCSFTGITTINEVTEKNVKELFLHGRIERGWSSNTFVVFQKSLIVFFRWCVKEGYLEKNPAADIETPRIEKRLPVRLTRQDALRLLEVVYNYPYSYRFLRYRNHAIFSMFLFAGLRRAELLNLRLMDIDIENLTIFVRQGKGSKDRLIPMSYTLAQTLSVYLGERKRLSKTCPEFFVSLTRNNGVSDQALKMLVNQIRAAFKKPFTMHRLRHTFATLMLEGGCDIYSLSKMMGHSDIKTTTIYLAASTEHLRSQITKHPLNTIRSAA